MSGIFLPGAPTEPEKLPEVYGIRIELYPYGTCARLLKRLLAGFDLIFTGASERGLKLNLAHEAVCLDHQVLSAVIYLWLRYLELSEFQKP